MRQDNWLKQWLQPSVPQSNNGYVDWKAEPGRNNSIERLATWKLSDAATWKNTSLLWKLEKHLTSMMEKACLRWQRERGHRGNSDGSIRLRENAARNNPLFAHRRGVGRNMIRAAPREFGGRGPGLGRSRLRRSGRPPVWSLVPYCGNWLDLEQLWPKSTGYYQVPKKHGHFFYTFTFTPTPIE